MPRAISWITGARRDFADFPMEVREHAYDALGLAARGGKADIAKPFRGLDHGVFEIALRHRGNTYRLIYHVQIDGDIWVLHAFQKKSKTGIKTPQVEVELIRERLKRLKEALK